MNCLVVGYGSIGQRHVRILRHQLNCRVAVVSQRKIEYPLRYSSLNDALIREKPDYVVIANQTDKHYGSLIKLAGAGFNGVVLVEKPLFQDIRQIPDNNFKGAFVGYNLRFHPIIQKLFDLIGKERILAAQVYVGQYLPAWRPGRDYRSSYSAEKSAGGGVLLDLSHELDYLRWFFGDWVNLAAIGGKYSSLPINSDDCYSLLFTMKECPMVLAHLNYLDRINRREVTMIAEGSTIKADLIQQTLQINGQLLKYNTERDYSYYLQHKAVVNNETNYLCTLDDGLKVLEFIKSAELSAKQRIWIDK